MDRPDNSLRAIAARFAAHMADPTSAAAIDRLDEQNSRSAVQMAVVDYIGFKYQNARGEVVTVDEYTCTAERYGARSMAHVAVYGFLILTMNGPAHMAHPEYGSAEDLAARIA